MATRSVISGSRNSISRDARKAFQIEGLKEIQDNLAKIVDGVTGKEMKAVYVDAAVVLRDQARENAPFDPKREKGTHLRDAIFAGKGDENKPNAMVGVRYKAPGAPHAHLQEYGWINSGGKPYFRPAISQSGPKMASMIKDGLTGIIRKHTK